MDPTLSQSASEEDDSRSDEEGGPGVLDLSRSFLAESDPRDITFVSPELEKTFDAATEQYYRTLEKKPKDLEYGDIDIFPVQYAVAHTFLKSKGTTQLKLEAGSGKTLIGVAVAELTRVCLILAPNNLLNTWYNAFNEIGIYNVRSPEKSIVLVYSSQKGGHNDYIKRAFEDGSLADRERTIIIAAGSAHKDRVHPMSFFTPEVVRGREFTLIVDEAAAPISGFPINVAPAILGRDEEVAPVTRTLLLSADDIDAKKLKSLGLPKIDHMIHVWKTNPMPNDVWNVILMPTESWKKDIVDENGKRINAELAWSKDVEKLVSMYKKVIISSDNDAIKMLEHRKVFGKKPLLKKKNQVHIEEDFNSLNEAAIFLPPQQKRGSSLNAEALIVLNPGESTTDRLIQLSKRLIRQNNPFSEVYLYMLCGTPQEYWRVTYAKAFSLERWHFGRSDVVNTSMVEKAVSCIRLLGHDHEQIDRVDLCVFLADYSVLRLLGKMDRPLQQILEWWNANKSENTILTEGIIQGLIFL